jgi:hypothetical protein
VDLRVADDNCNLAIDHAEWFRSVLQIAGFERTDMETDYTEKLLETYLMRQTVPGPDAHHITLFAASK